MTITTLKPSMTADDRAFAAVRTLTVTLERLKEMAETDPQALQFFLIELDDADSAITLLRARLSMKRSVTHLTGMMGRAP